MTRRSDGTSTRERLFEAACRVFGERGYRCGTHAEICEAAQANIAAINYHFGSKEALYREVSAFAMREIDRKYPLKREQEGLPEERLRAFIEMILARGAEDEKLRFYQGLRIHEFGEPSGVADDLWSAWFSRHRHALEDIIRELLGECASPELLERCRVSIVGACFLVNFVRSRTNGVAIPLQYVDDKTTTIDHLVSFSLAGVAAARAVAAGIHTSPNATQEVCP